MTRTRLTLLASLVLTAGCAQEHPGTQIGSEDELRCELISSDLVTDLTLTPDGFTTSPRDLIDSLVGDFSGPPLDDQEQPTAGTVELAVTDPGGDVTVERFEAAVDDGDGVTADSLADACPPRYVTTLGFHLESDDLPTFDAVLPVQGNDGLGGASTDPAQFDAALPPPTTFALADFPESQQEVDFGGGSGAWWVYVGWEAWDPADAAADGDLPITSELLLMARLDAQ